MRKMLRSIYGDVKYLYEFSGFFSKAVKYSRQLKTVQNNTKSIKRTDILLFCTLKNEAHRIEYFLDYYRKLGVNHFLFVDNGSDDGFIDLVSASEDISVFYTEGGYKDSNFGMHWLNFLLWKYGTGHWCFTCDPDEFLVYPHVESRDLVDLTQYLDSINEEVLFTPMVDMYSSQPVSQTEYIPGTDPLSVCPFFDKSSYSKKFDKKYKNLWLQGGVRQRVFASQAPETAPALNKVSLIKWKWYNAYVESMHMAIPRKLNQACYETKTSGAVLHFKFISKLKEKVDEELIQKQHFNDSAEYKQYGQVVDNNEILFDAGVSKRYEGWTTLSELGFINKGEWS